MCMCVCVLRWQRVPHFPAHWWDRPLSWEPDGLLLLMFSMCRVSPKKFLLKPVMPLDFRKARNESHCYLTHAKFASSKTIQNTDSARTIPVWWNSVKPLTLKVKRWFTCCRFRTIATLNRLMCSPDLLIEAIVRNWVSKILKGTFLGHTVLCSNTDWLLPMMC